VQFLRATLPTSSSRPYDPIARLIMFSFLSGASAVVGFSLAIVFPLPLGLLMPWLRRQRGGPCWAFPASFFPAITPPIQDWGGPTALPCLFISQPPWARRFLPSISLRIVHELSCPHSGSSSFARPEFLFFGHTLSFRRWLGRFPPCSQVWSAFRKEPWLVGELVDDSAEAFCLKAATPLAPWVPSRDGGTP